jgi:hypothetical protein
MAPTRRGGITIKMQLHAGPMWSARGFHKNRKLGMLKLDGHSIFRSCDNFIVQHNCPQGKGGTSNNVAP